MQFNLYLSLDGTDQCATITVPATMHLEDLAIRIQMALRLPFTDEGWHQFRAFGRVYMPETHICAEEEIRGECDLPYIPIRPSERPRLLNVFTVLGSDLSYTQSWCTGHYSVRCTLLERIGA